MNSRLTSITLAFALAGCSAGAPSSLPSMQSTSALHALNSTGAGKITHVVYILQENRSFDNLFAGYPGTIRPVDPAVLGDGVHFKEPFLRENADVFVKLLAP